MKQHRVGLGGLSKAINLRISCP